jgi:hypothetical protein
VRAIPPVERRVVMDKFDVVFVVVVLGLCAVIEVVMVVDVMTSPDVVVVGSGEGVYEID